MHSPTLHHISGKGQNHSPNWRGRRVGGNVFSVTAISHALEYPGGSLLSVIIDIVKWRRLKRSLQAPLINLAIIFISPCIFLTDGRSRGQTLLERPVSWRSRSPSLLLSRDGRSCRQSAPSKWAAQGAGPSPLRL